MTLPPFLLASFVPVYLFNSVIQVLISQSYKFSFLFHCLPNGQYCSNSIAFPARERILLAAMKPMNFILIAICSFVAVAAEDRWANVTKTLTKYVAISKMAFSVGNASGQQYSFGKGGVTLETQQTMASSSKVCEGD